MSIVVLAGPVAAGKSTVARELVKISPESVAYIDGDEFWQFIAKVPPDQKVIDSFKTVIRAMTRAATAFARDGFEVILDFSIPPGFIEGLMARVKDLPIDYVILLPTRAVCAARAAARPVGTIADYSRFDRLYSAFWPIEPYTIRNDTLDPAGVARRIRDGVDAGTFRVPPGSTFVRMTGPPDPGGADRSGGEVDSE